VEGEIGRILFYSSVPLFVVLLFRFVAFFCLCFVFADYYFLCDVFVCVVCVCVFLGLELTPQTKENLTRIVKNFDIIEEKFDNLEKNMEEKFANIKISSPSK